MLGAVIGDIAGSRFEFDNYRHTDFDIFSPDSNFTDDTICTVAIADWVLQGCNDNLASILQGWCRAYPCPKGAYGGRFSQWIEWKDPEPYNSWGKCPTDCRNTHGRAVAPAVIRFRIFPFYPL